MNPGGGHFGRLLFGAVLSSQQAEPCEAGKIRCTHFNKDANIAKQGPELTYWLAAMQMVNESGTLPDACLDHVGHPFAEPCFE